MISGCPVYMFDQARFNFKVKIQGKTLYDCIIVSALQLMEGSLGDILKWLGTKLKYHETMSGVNVSPRSLRSQCHS